MKYLLIFAFALVGCNAAPPSGLTPAPSVITEPAEQPIVLRQPKQRNPAALKHDKVIFVVSCGGSMLSQFGEVKQGLKEGISELGPEQQVNVIFCNGDGAAPFEKSNLVTATPKTKEDILNFIDNAVSSGLSDISPGLAAAREQGPDLIWVISNGLPHG